MFAAVSNFLTNFSMKELLITLSYLQKSLKKSIIFKIFLLGFGGMYFFENSDLNFPIKQRNEHCGIGIQSFKVSYVKKIPEYYESLTLIYVINDYIILKFWLKIKVLQKHLILF